MSRNARFVARSCVTFRATLVILPFLVLIISCINPVGLVVPSKLHLGSTCLLEGCLMFANKFDFPRILQGFTRKSLPKTIDSYLMWLCNKLWKCDHLLISCGTWKTMHLLLGKYWFSVSPAVAICHVVLKCEDLMKLGDFCQFLTERVALVFVINPFSIKMEDIN